MTRFFLRSRTGRPSSWGALLGLFLLLAAVPDFHPAGERHGLLEPLGGAEYSPEATHPEEPLHLEPGAVVSQPHCPVCLHRLQLGGLHLTAAAGLVPPPSREHLAEVVAPSRARGIYSPSGARAPPFS